MGNLQQDSRRPTLADPNVAFSLGANQWITPLAKAAAMGHRDVVKLLLARGANPTAQDMNLIVRSSREIKPMPSILMYAAEGGDVDILRLLVERGQDPNFRSARGQTALDVAISRKNEAAAEYLRSVTQI